MEGLKERDKGRGLWGTQVISVRRHIAAPLNHLPDELILGELHSRLIERRTALSTGFAERVAVAALFGLKNQGSLPLQRASADEILSGDGLAAPGVHDRAPRRVLAQMGQSSQPHRNEQHPEHGYRPTLPTLLALSSEEAQSDQYHQS